MRAPGPPAWPIRRPCSCSRKRHDDRDPLAGLGLLRTKLHTPLSRANLVPRRHLLALLNTQPQRALTVVCAPAGFGKTTLLGEWAAQAGRRVAWVSLDRGDNDPQRFWSYFIAGLETLKPGFGRHALSLLRSFDAHNTDIFLVALLNEIGTWEDEFSLVLDDYHFIESPVLQDAVAYVIEHAPPQMHLLLATRTLPDLPLSRLRARDQLTELNVADLAFDRDETLAFFDRHPLAHLSTEEILALHARTEGWVAGLQLVAHSIRSRPDVIRSVARLSGTQRAIADYLTDEVLGLQPPDIQDFLLKTSILDRLSGPLCDAVLGATEQTSQAVLEQLEAANVFILALDEERRWYRYHALFAELLREKLAVTFAADVAGLYRRAAAWYAENELPDEAIQMALAGQDPGLAAQLIEETYHLKVKRSEVSTLGEWVRALPPELVHQRPRLCLALAWSYVPTGNLGEVDACLGVAERLARQA